MSTESDRTQPIEDETAAHDRRSVVAQEREHFGGMKLGSAFFGWLTAIGMSVLLVALVAAAGAAVGLATDTDVDTARDEAAANPETVGLVGGIALLVILFVAYFAGGYVAARMARFDGAKQGLAVWLWAVLVAIVVAALGAIAGNEYDVLATSNGWPRLPLNEGDPTTGGIVAVIAALLVTLVGAVLGGLAGTRYHRRVDRAGFGE